MTMNVVGRLKNIINECLNYFLVISNTLVCKYFIIKFVVFLSSLIFQRIMRKTLNRNNSALLHTLKIKIEGISYSSQISFLFHLL